VITWLYNGGKVGSASSTTQQRTIGENHSSIPTPTYANHDFLGWKDMSGQIKTKEQILETPISGNETYVAQWQQMTCEVKFNSNGGLPGVMTREYPYGSEIGYLPIPDEFPDLAISLAGWYTRLSGGEKITPNTEVVEDTTYYAHWNRYIHYIERGELQNENGVYSGFGESSFLETIKKIDFNNPFVFMLDATTGYSIEGEEQEIVAMSTEPIRLEAGTYQGRFSWEFEELHWDQHGDKILPNANTEYLVKIDNDGKTTSFSAKEKDADDWVVDWIGTDTGHLPTRRIRFGNDVDKLD
jgi:hypothetical protein